MRAFGQDRAERMKGVALEGHGWGHEADKDNWGVQGRGRGVGRGWDVRAVCMAGGSDGYRNFLEAIFCHCSALSALRYLRSAWAGGGGSALGSSTRITGPILNKTPDAGPPTIPSALLLVCVYCARLLAHTCGNPSSNLPQHFLKSFFFLQNGFLGTRGASKRDAMSALDSQVKSAVRAPLQTSDARPQLFGTRLD
jgi:hypothetical protein